MRAFEEVKRWSSRFPKGGLKELGASSESSWVAEIAEQGALQMWAAQNEDIVRRAAVELLRLSMAAAMRASAADLRKQLAHRSAERWPEQLRTLKAPMLLRMATSLGLGLPPEPNQEDSSTNTYDSATAWAVAVLADEVVLRGAACWLDRLTPTRLGLVASWTKAIEPGSYRRAAVTVAVLADAFNLDPVLEYALTTPNTMVKVPTPATPPSSPVASPKPSTKSGLPSPKNLDPPSPKRFKSAEPSPGTPSSPALTSLKGFDTGHMTESGAWVPPDVKNIRKGATRAYLNDQFDATTLRTFCRSQGIRSGKKSAMIADILKFLSSSGGRKK